MDRSIPLLVIGLVLGGGLGFTFAAGQGITLDGHDHSDPAHHGAHAGGAGGGQGAAHDHGEMLELPAGPDAPALALALSEDPASGWNLQIQTQNFTFAPANASTAHVPGEGHAHLYVNGEKRARLYGPWVHLADLPDGPVELAVTLNANDHRLLAVEGKALREVVTLQN
ncbi:hypothetical protein [Roseivivax sp.]